MRAKPRVFTPRKLLVAAFGVASVNYVLACEKPYTSGNLMAPPAAPDAEPPTIPPTSGNLPAPPPEVLAPPADAGAAKEAPKDAGAAKDAGAPKDAGAKSPVINVPRKPPTSGNLMAPGGDRP